MTKIITALAALFFFSTSQATLIGVLPATPGGTDWQAYYDDLLNITWAANVSINGADTWGNQTAWAAGLSIGGISGWRLPDADVNNDGTIEFCGGANDPGCVDNEMEHLYTIQGITQASPGPFSGMPAPPAQFWALNEQPNNPDGAWFFGFGSGGQTWADKVENPRYAWAVRDGDTPRPARDLTGVTDISGDAVPDVAVLSQLAGKRPRVRYYSGANRKKFAQVAYLSNAWAGVAAATLADGNQDRMADDPAVAVLGRRISNGRLSVQVLPAAGGAELARISFLNNRWTPVDLVVIDDANGDGVSDDTAIGVLGLNPAQGSQKQTTLQVRRLSDGSLLREVFFNNNNWTPLAAGAVQRPGRSPLLAVLAERNSNKEIRVQTRVLSDGLFQSNKTYLSDRWRGKDLAVLRDANGDSVLDDASYMVLAVNPGNGLNRLQVRRTGGALVKNVTVLNEQWRARRILGSDDISGNLFEELGVLGNRISDGKAKLELTDFATEDNSGNIFP